MQFKDYYAELGVEPGALEKDIKSAYRRLARRYHPDVSKETDAEERFKAVNEAYEVLHDTQKRTAYDQLRARGYRPGEEFQPPPDFGEGFEFDLGEVFARAGTRQRGAGPGGPGGFSDFFESLFGGMRGGAGGFDRPEGGADLRARIEVPVQLAYSGGMRRIAVQGRTLDVGIPAGVRSGQVIRLAGQGSQGPRGKAGDLLLEVVVAGDPRFQIDGRNVSCRLPLAPWEAALGTRLAVPTLGGEVELTIPPGTANGQRMRLRGRGLPGTPPGDQFVVVELVQPAPSTQAERDAYAALATAFGDWKPVGRR
ncbi:MAG TPA: DnaJ C-terminal domain-containing protein [Xanthomonadaceae bacterium]|nr:DnaJ C-terminal domain-containing protein [Xanthomonadaceae bacterium]